MGARLARNTKGHRGSPLLGDPTAIAQPLRTWYLAAQRDLPWRHTRDPYAVWLSEIMCQQTRVSVVIPYYERFLARFPTPADLAAADETEVLELWAGLGYYSRGRNLHRAAGEMVREHGGAFPSEPDSIRALPGIGEYTAAAIGSIVFGHARPVIDGNVERVLARHGAIPGDPKRGEARRDLREAAEHALDLDHPGDHNQGMMELGATVCTPRNPLCGTCPIAASCRAHSIGTPEAFPPPRKRRAPETQHWLALLVGVEGRVTTIARSKEEELLPGHRGLPLVRLADTASPSEGEIRREAAKLLEELGIEVIDPRALDLFPPVPHSITYRRLRIHPVQLEGALVSQDAELIDGKDGARLPALFRKVIAAIHAPPAP